jgi:hypothetical protein
MPGSARDSTMDFLPRAGFDQTGKERGRIWIDNKVHLYTGPKGVRFVPIFGKSADFFENKFARGV